MMKKKIISLCIFISNANHPKLSLANINCFQPIITWHSPVNHYPTFSSTELIYQEGEARANCPWKSGLTDYCTETQLMH